MGHTRTDSLWGSARHPRLPPAPFSSATPHGPARQQRPHNLQRSLFARAASFPVCRGAVTRTVGQVVTVDAAPAGRGHRDPISFFRVFPLSVLLFFSFSIFKNKI